MYVGHQPPKCRQLCNYIFCLNSHNGNVNNISHWNVKLYQAINSDGANWGGSPDNHQATDQ